jgi:hypothetical protein
MREEKAFATVLFVIGLVLLVTGSNAYFSKVRHWGVCEACGMEMWVGDDPYVYRIKTDDDVSHHACCPICALAIADYYKNATILTTCIMNKERMKIVVVNGDLSSVMMGFPEYASVGLHSVRVILGDECSRREIFCSQECVEEFKKMPWARDWAKDLPIIMLEEAFSGARETEFTIEQRQIGIPIVTYLCTSLGIVFLASSLITWRVTKKKTLR